jgi:hypothetical protein
MKGILDVLLTVLSAIEQNKHLLNNEHDCSSNSNSVLIGTQTLLKELLTDLIKTYSHIDIGVVSEVTDVIQAIGRSNTNSESASNAVVGMTSAASAAAYGLGLPGANAGVGIGIAGANAGGVTAPAGTPSYSEADELNEALQETNIILRRIFLKNYDCESDYSKQIALINLFSELKNVIDHYKDYIKEHPNPLISKYLAKMADVLPSIDPSDSKNKLSKDQFIAIAAILMIINYMLCYTNNLTSWN